MIKLDNRNACLAAVSVLALAACASTGGSSIDGPPQPVIDPVTEAPAAPKNLVLERTSFRSGNDGAGRDETYDVTTRTLVVSAEANGAILYEDTVYADAGTGQRMSYDAGTNQFTFEIDHRGGTGFDPLSPDDTGTLVTFSETFGPLLLVTPKALDDLYNGVGAVYLATQGHAYPISRDFIDGDVRKADQFLSAVYAIGGETSGYGAISTWQSMISNRGTVETDTTQRSLGNLPLLVAYQPGRYGAPSGVQGDVGAAADYLSALDTDGFADARASAPSASTDLLASLLDFAPNAFSVSPTALIASGGGQRMIESLQELGGRQSASMAEAISNGTARIENGPGFYYTTGEVTYYQYRTDKNAIPTRFVAAGEWAAPTEDGAQYGHVVFGELTDPDEMPVTGTASYEGTIYGSVARQNDVQTLRGGFNVSTDFTLGTLEMEMDANLAYLDGEGVTRYVDYATFEGAGDIHGAAFDGTMIGTLDRGVADGTDVLEGSFDGHFYGPTAQEIGGTFEFTGSEAAGAGAFVGRDKASGPEG